MKDYRDWRVILSQGMLKKSADLRQVEEDPEKVSWLDLYYIQAFLEGQLMNIPPF